MKNAIFSIVAAVVLVTLPVACVSLTDKEMTVQERAQTQYLGQLTVNFNSWQVLHIINSKKIKQKAYVELIKSARQIYQGDVEVVNINIIGSGTGLMALNALGHILGGIMAFASPSAYYDLSPFVGLPLGIGGLAILVASGNSQKITVTGEVIRISRTAQSFLANEEKLAEAVNKASETLINRISGNATVAILSVYSNNLASSEYVINELEYKFVEAGKFRIVDRRRLEQIRSEQNFQMSGDVDDNSAVSIGNMLGASVVITGEITGSGSSNRLVLRALDVQTAQILTMAREQF
jgi:hypothetical protein